MKVYLLKDNTDLDKVSEVLLQLRPSYNLNSIKQQIAEQQRSGYTIAYVKSGDDVLCVAGFVLCQKLAWGKHIYIDDLVTDESHRSSGAGSLLISWIKDYAKEIGCKELHLDSGVQRFGAHRFYLREKFDITAHHFAITII